MVTLKLTVLFVLVTLLLSVTIVSARAQVEYRIEPNSATITLQGTSTLHEWSMTAHRFTGNAAFVTDSNTIESLTSLNVSVPVRSLKSDNSTMDNNAYADLKAAQFPEIDFQLTSATVTAPKQIANTIVTDNDTVVTIIAPTSTVDTIAAYGNLFVAGVAKNVTLHATAEVLGNGSISVTGSTKVKMSDFNITPPSYMFGAIKTADEITLDFSVTMVKAMRVAGAPDPYLHAK